MIGLEYVLFIKEISATHLAEELGVSAQLVHHWIKGRRTIGQEHLAYLEKKLGVTSEYLVKHIDGKGRIKIETLLMGLDGEDAVFTNTMVELENMKKNYAKLLNKYTEQLESKNELKKQLKSYIDTL